MILDNAQVPLYVQLADLFRQRILKGMWREGEKLPSLEKLVEEFEVARVTVRQAVDRLSRDGLVSPRRGRGTFVTGAPQANRWLRVETTLQNLADVYRDTHPTILNIDESTRSPRLAETDGVAAPKYVYMRRIHERDGRPYCVIDIYLDAEIFARHPVRFRRETVIPLLMEMPSVKIVTARQVLTILTEVARHLGVSVNAPGLTCGASSPARSGAPSILAKSRIVAISCTWESTSSRDPCGRPVCRPIFVDSPENTSCIPTPSSTSTAPGAPAWPVASTRSSTRPPVPSSATSPGPIAPISTAPSRRPRKASRPGARSRPTSARRS